MKAYPKCGVELSIVAWVLFLVMLVGAILCLVQSAHAADTNGEWNSVNTQLGPGGGGGDGNATQALPGQLHDTERGTRLDNLLHCILLRVDIGAFPIDWREVCAKLMAETPKRKEPE